MTTMNFQVTGMHCGACANTVRQQVEQVAGVQTLTIDPSSGSLIVDSDGALDEAIVLAAVKDAGYDAVRT